MRTTQPLLLPALLAASVASAAPSSTSTDRPQVAIVPGCPVAADGSLGPCLTRRVLWAHTLWKRGEVNHFITSGNAVYTPYVEAEALAAGLTALGVPADHIALEPDALHTDENMFNGMLIAEREGWYIHVASDGMHARSGCWMVRAWGAECTVHRLDWREVEDARAEHGETLSAVTVAEAEDFIPLEERHAARFAETGWRRPNSIVLYHLDALRLLFGDARVPYTSNGKGTARTWADYLRHGRTAK